jgi:hypothetical protein
MKVDGPGLNKPSPGVIPRSPWKIRLVLTSTGASPGTAGAAIGDPAARAVVPAGVAAVGGAGPGVGSKSALLLAGLVAVPAGAVSSPGSRVRGVEGLPCLLLCVMLLAQLLEEKIRAGTSKGMWRELGLDCWLQVAVLWVEVAQEVEHLARL